MQLIFREYKNAERRLLAFTDDDVSDAQLDDPKLRKMLSHMNLQLQALDEELDNDFDALVPPNTATASLHR